MYKNFTWMAWDRSFVEIRRCVDTLSAFWKFNTRPEGLYISISLIQLTLSVYDPHVALSWFRHKRKRVRAGVWLRRVLDIETLSVPRAPRATVQIRIGPSWHFRCRAEKRWQDGKAPDRSRWFRFQIWLAFGKSGCQDNGNWSRIRGNRIRCQPVAGIRWRNCWDFSVNIG